MANKSVPNKKLRLKIAEMIYKANEGHIPSAYSIVEILNVLYSKFLRFKVSNPNWSKRDYFILSKGHGCAALYVLLEKYGFIKSKELDQKSKIGGILGGHPDASQIPGVEASTGSLGHGVVTAMGIALGLAIRKMNNKVVALVGDGECNEGTVWETALVARNLSLGNFCVIVDENGSSDQILPVEPLAKKWRAFGWKTYEVDGHNEGQILSALVRISFTYPGIPHAIIVHTVKGKGVSFLEGHGAWHSKVPNAEEMKKIRKELS